MSADLDLNTTPSSPDTTAPADPQATRLSIRERILAADDITTETMEIPEWGVTVAVRTMTGAARAEMLVSASDPTTGEVNYQTLYPQVIVASVIDPETGESVFTVEDVNALNLKSAAVVERVAQAGMRVSGMTKEAEKELGNDSATQSGGSTSN